MVRGSTPPGFRSVLLALLVGIVFSACTRTPPVGRTSTGGKAASQAEGVTPRIDKDIAAKGAALEGSATAAVDAADGSAEASASAAAEVAAKEGIAADESSAARDGIAADEAPAKDGAAAEEASEDEPPQFAWHKPEAPFAIPAEPLHTEDGLEQLLRQLPAYDVATGAALLDMSEHPCCADDHVWRVSLYLPKGASGPFTAAREVWTLSITNTEGDETMSQPKRVAQGKSLLAHLRSRNYTQLDSLHSFSSPSGWWIGGSPQIVDASGELRQQGARLSFTPAGQTGIGITLPSISKHPFCCGIPADAEGNWPDDAECAAAPQTRGVWRHPPSGLFIVLSGNNHGPDTCEADDSWQWMRAPAPNP